MHREAGLQKALFEAKASCTDESLQQQRRADIADEEQKLKARSAKLEEAQKKGKTDKIRKAQRKQNWLVEIRSYFLDWIVSNGPPRIDAFRLKLPVARLGYSHQTLFFLLDILQAITYAVNTMRCGLVSLLWLSTNYGFEKFDILMINMTFFSVCDDTDY